MEFGVKLCFRKFKGLPHLTMASKNLRMNDFIFSIRKCPENFVNDEEGEEEPSNYEIMTEIRAVGDRLGRIEEILESLLLKNNKEIEENDIVETSAPKNNFSNTESESILKYTEYKEESNPMQDEEESVMEETNELNELQSESDYSATLLT